VRIIILAFLGATAAIFVANAQSMDELLQQQKVKQEKQLVRVLELTKPLGDCVKKRAHSYELYSSLEKADVVARAAVGLCSKEEGAYRSALFQLAIVATDFDADAKAKQMHNLLVETALTIIVTERQRQRAQPPAAVETETAASTKTEDSAF
jgi:hypothetical protein